MVASSTRGVPASWAARHADAVHRDVVGVAVAAVLVVDGQHVGLLLLEDGCQSFGGVRQRRAAERGRAARGAVHAGVLVAEQLDPGAAEQPRGPGQLGRPDRSQPALLAGRVGQPGAAGGRGDEHDAVPGGRHPGQGAAGEQHLVVGVGVEGHDGPGRRHDAASSSSTGIRPASAAARR